MSEASEELGQLCLQVHADLSPGINTAELKLAAELLAKSIPGVRGIGFSEGEDEGAYLNIIFASTDPRQAWTSIRKGLLESSSFSSQLKAASIAMCTGADGWNDYVLLHHYDPTVSPDGTSEA
jgi:hypothetical protein